MSTSERSALVAICAAALAACASLPSSPGKPPAFGAAVSAEEIARSDISIPPSGAGLPAGSGTAKQGAVVYGAKCLACHGEKGTGKPADALVGGIGSLATARPVRTVGSYWPYATTLFDYLRRAMPITNPLSLSDDEVYAVSAYVLFLNGIVGEDMVMNAQTLPQVKMPNRDGFVSDWPPRARN
ncbi:MAG: c-type cytochrome [Betaproteobacteria bacterium]|nr:MAG: c-type cytochrome [Betaproteobacteria bacterium]